MDDKILYIWHAGDDNDEEGIFLNWYTNQPMSYLPFGDGRPYSSAPTYNYLTTWRKVTRHNDTNFEINGEAKIYDVGDHVKAIAICTIQSRSLKFYIRGLCSDFSFDREYVFTVEEDGLEVYKGIKTSMIAFNRTTKLWHLYKPRDNSSLVTSAASLDSLMIGLHTFNFEQAQEEKCYQDKKLQRVKLTTCTAGFFTCKSGDCIPMHKRCDQTTNCPDESDESECKLMVMKNYNKNIPPFTIDAMNDEIIPGRFSSHLSF